jgi:hypothetical protein
VGREAGEFVEVSPSVPTERSLLEVDPSRPAPADVPECLGEGLGDRPESDELPAVSEGFSRSTEVVEYVLDLNAFWRLKVPFSPTATDPDLRMGAG